jgi:hypothetical protein
MQTYMLIMQVIRILFNVNAALIKLGLHLES